MRIVVEFLGDARLATQIRQTELEITQGTSFRDLVRLISDRFPALVGAVIEEDGETLMPANILNLNGKRTIQSTQLDDVLSDGDRITFMSVLAGG
jgi:molybdopterin converting factor small subunit